MSEKIKFAVKNVFRKGISAILTITGIAVGVASVVIIGAMSDSGKAAVSHELDSLGLCGITVSAESQNESLNFDDAKILRDIDGVKNVTPLCSLTTEVQNGDKSEQAMLWGNDNVGSSFFSQKVIYGKSISLSQIADCEAVCMTDAKIAKKLFGRENAVGKYIDINAAGNMQKCKIIGITVSDSTILQSVGGEIVPDFVYVPYTWLGAMCKSDSVKTIAVTISDGYDTADVSRKIEKTLDAEKGGGDVVKCENLSVQRDKLDNILSIITTVLSAIGAISLVVSGLGIMTVMLVSVSERTREIGVKKSVGASFSDVLSEFLTEALTISAIGSIIGAVIGAAVAFFGGLAFNVRYDFNIVTVLFAVISAVLSGVIFGLYPAIKAAKMKPVDALRYE